MDGAHVHLLLTHVPVIGTVLGLLLLAYARIGNKTEVVKASLGVFVVAGLAAVVVYLTGEAAEEVIEGLPGISHDIIETHEEAGLVALIAAGVLGVVSLGGLLFAGKGAPRWFVNLTLVLALVVSGIMAWTANLGGQINHPEIRSETTVVSTPGDTPATSYDEEDD